MDYEEKYFVGRKKEIAQYLDLLKQFLDEYENNAALDCPARSSCVLNIYGVGGMGKTSLLKHFVKLTEEERLSHSNLSCIYLDTSGYDNFIEVLHSIRNKLEFFYSDPLIPAGNFFEFDTMYTLFYCDKDTDNSESLFKIILSQCVKSILISDVAETVIRGILQSQPVDRPEIAVTLITEVIAALPGIADRVRKTVKRKIETEKLLDELKEIQQHLGSAYERQQFMLAAFIKEAKNLLEINPVVLILDNLQEEGDYGRLLRDYSWLTGRKGLIASITALYVLGGRDSVDIYMKHLQEENKIRYQSIALPGIQFENISQFYREKCGLDVKNDTAGIKMLQAACIKKDPVIGKGDEEIENIEELEKQQYLPLWMNLAADHYNQIKEQKVNRGDVEPVKADELGNLKNEEDLCYYFEMHLSEMKRDAFYILSCMDVWDEKWLNLVKERFDNYLLSAVHVLRTNSTVEVLEDNKIKIHDALKESLQKSDRNQLKIDVEEWIFLYFLHMQNIGHTESMIFRCEPYAIDNIGELRIYAYVGMNYIKWIMEKKTRERFTYEHAMDYFQQAFLVSIRMYESEEKANDDIISIVRYLANEADKLWNGRKYALEYRRHLTLLYSYSSRFSDALKESERLLEECEERVSSVPPLSRNFDNYIQICSDRNDAYNGLGYDLGDIWRYPKAAEYGFRSVKNQYSLIKEAEAYLWFDTLEERQAYKYFLDVCEWGNYEYDENELNKNVEILKNTSYYKEREEGKSNGLIRRYLKARGNIPWYYLRLPAQEREKYEDFEPVLFGRQTFELRRAFYGWNRFTLTSYHNVSVYLKGEQRYREALEWSSDVYEKAKKYLKKKFGQEERKAEEERIEKLSLKKMQDLRDLDLIPEDRIEGAYKKYRELLFCDNLVIEVLQYHSNYSLCVALEAVGENRKHYIDQAQEEGEGAAVLRYISRNDKDSGFLTSLSFLASYYYAQFKYRKEEQKKERALTIVGYIIRQLENLSSEAGRGRNEQKLEEHRTMLVEMKNGEWSESHRFAENV